MTERAEQERSAQRSVRAEAVARLRWLPPGAASLAALARSPGPGTWDEIRADPGALLLLLRQPLPHPDRPYRTRLDSPGTLETALQELTLPPSGFVDWDAPPVRPVYRAGLTYARLARQLAERTGLVDRDDAWVCGLLAPLGWLALSAVDPAAVTDCLADPAFARDPTGTQSRLWGIDQTGIARRIARRWRLPGWLRAVIGQLALPRAVAEQFGADPVLFALTRLAVHRGQTLGHDLGLADPAFAAEDAAALGLSPDESDKVCLGSDAGVPAAAAWQDPYAQPLLTDLLAAAAENRRLRDAPLHRDLEQEVDDLRGALAAQVKGEADRLQAAKLTALAEFAAGAGHEINNPLAVISGQAQYLLGHEESWFPGEFGEDVRKSLRAIVSQTRRIHAVLRDLMQFARPLPPRPGWVELPALLGEVASAVGELAARRGVRVGVECRPERLAVYADADQLRQALTCLLCNAVEAAPPEGWARLHLVEPAGGDVVEVAVEDSGPGPDGAQRASLFDPFYSGRAAGRGRGLGLPIAWRLARQQGGDVYLDAPGPGRPTRFVLRLPRTPGVPPLAA